MPLLALSVLLSYDLTWRTNFAGQRSTHTMGLHDLFES